MLLMQIDWSDALALSMPATEIVLRGSLMYWFLFLVFRFILRRDVGALGIGDFLFVAIVADASQNAMSGDSKSVADGALLVATLVFWNYLFDFMSYKIPIARRFLESPPLLLVRDGQFLLKNMRHELITKDEIITKLREEGLESVTEVKKMYLESNGEISLIKNSG
jgi:uncharacterized membrane protein YcaP (DUF421 family)